MNEAANAAQTVQNTKFILRRLEEPFAIGSWEGHWFWWLVLLGIVLFVAFVYVVVMYVRDSGSIGLLWASLLGFMRLSIYALLAYVFLLPADQQTYVTTTQSKTIVLFDVSDSMHVTDELPTADPNHKPRTRMDDVYRFITDDNVDFIGKLQEKNPVTVYRFGTRLDPEYVHFADGVAWTRDEHENPVKDEKGEVIPPPKRPLGEDYWRAFLTPNPPPGFKLDNLGDELDRARMEKLQAANKKSFDNKLHRGTNLGEALLAVLNREANSRLQGIVVFTDGRSNEGGGGAFAELAARAKAAKVPIFVVGIGEDRQKIKIEINELRAPATIQPDDKFRLVADITGEGLVDPKDKRLDVKLEITHVRTYKDKVKGKDGKIAEVDREEQLDLAIIETEPEKAPKDYKRTLIPLGKKIELVAEPPAVLDKANPPRVEVEWNLDALTLAAKAGIDVEKLKNKRWEIAECKEDSELRFVVRVPVDKREGAVKKKVKGKDGKQTEVITKVHESEPSGMKVIKKPIRVLLMAAAANRDYQFVRTLLVRETEKKRMDLAIYLQLPPGEIKRRPGVVQDVPPERLLSTFPDTLGKKKNDVYDLTSYDVIIAFDPDWNQLTIDQVANIKTWADKGGGFIYVGGHINTVEITRPRDGLDKDRYKPILDMLPVELDDRREVGRENTDKPFPLVFDKATPEMEFLKLDEELDETKFKQDWMKFFYGDSKEQATVERGFFTYYPVRELKPTALVVARFADPAFKMKDGTLPPWLVMNPEQLTRTIWIGSAETWRLREYRDEYHERFWTKLVKFASAKSKGGALQSIRAEMARTHRVNKPIAVEARIDGLDGKPLAARERDQMPRITLKMPLGVDDKEVQQPIVMNPRPGARDGWFNTSFLVKSPGEYELTIKVPKQPGQDSEQTTTQRFLVKEANPELDNVRPDFTRMYRTASDAEEVVMQRVADSEKGQLRQRLSKPKLQEEAGEGKDEKVDVRDDRLKLYFDLGNASLIPLCIVEDKQKQTSVGEITDRWSEDFVDLSYRLGLRKNAEGKKVWIPPSNKERPYKEKRFSWVLCLAVGLFCAEWLIRKLLRLA